jgi:hypothetical protein
MRRRWEDREFEASDFFDGDVDVDVIWMFVAMREERDRGVGVLRIATRFLG